MAFSAIPLAHLAREFIATEVGSILKAANEAISQAEAEGSPTKHAQRLARLVDAIARVADRTRARLESLREQQQLDGRAQ